MGLCSHDELEQLPAHRAANAKSTPGATQDYGLSFARPDNSQAHKTSSGSAGADGSQALQVGDRVEANYLGKGRWYPGVIAKVHLEDGT